MPKLIVGLGNPGKEYEKTRHNIGFSILDRFSRRHGISFDHKKKLSGELTKFIFREKSVILLKPLTFMNRSGKSVQETMQFYKLTSKDVIVVYDDADLDFGDIRIKEQGSSAGHNGMQSIMDHAGSTEITRLRIGIGRPPKATIPLEDWVLAKWTDDEITDLDSITTKAIEKIEEWIVL